MTEALSPPLLWTKAAGCELLFYKWQTHKLFQKQKKNLYIINRCVSWSELLWKRPGETASVMRLKSVGLVGRKVLTELSVNLQVSPVNMDVWLSAASGSGSEVFSLRFDSWSDCEHRQVYHKKQTCRPFGTKTPASSESGDTAGADIFSSVASSTNQGDGGGHRQLPDPSEAPGPRDQQRQGRHQQETLESQ